MSELISIGYRRLNDKLWVKPLGFSLLVIDVEKQMFIQYFYSLEGDIKIWVSEKLNDFKKSNEEKLNEIEYLENNIIKLNFNNSKSFRFLTLEESMSIF
jgi:hypothetical protein